MTQPDKAAPYEWTCAGCGKPSPNKMRSCDCPTNVVCWGRKREWKVDVMPDKAALADRMSDWYPVEGEKRGFYFNAAELQTIVDALRSDGMWESEANKAVLELCRNHGFATGHGDTLADIITEIDGQIRSASGMRAARIVELNTIVAACMTEVERLRAALTEIAAFDDNRANHLLASNNSYSGFDEPGSVAIARAALAIPQALP